MSDFILSAPEGANKKKRIVGRGSSSGRGTTAGRGNKGQQSRSGGKVYVGFEGGHVITSYSIHYTKLYEARAGTRIPANTPTCSMKT